MRKPNGYGHITKLAGNRRRPYAVRRIIGWSDTGKPRYKYLSYHRTLREAERALSQYNTDPYTLSSMTLKQVYEEWLPLQNRADGTIKAYKTAFKKLKPLHDMKMTQIDSVTLQQYYDSLDGTKNTSTNVKKLLSNLIKYCVKRKGILPVSALSIHKAIDFSEREEGRTTERKLIPKETIRQFWTMLDSELVKQVLIYIYTGCRFAELHDLQPENCHENYIEIVESKTDAGRRIVPLCDKIKTILPVEPIPSYDVFNRRFKELLPGYHIHDTRHTFVTYMTEAGIDSRIVKAVVGHKDSDITSAYTHITIDAMLDAVNTFADFLSKKTEKDQNL